MKGHDTAGRYIGLGLSMPAPARERAFRECAVLDRPDRGLAK